MDSIRKQLKQATESLRSEKTISTDTELDKRIAECHSAVPSLFTLPDADITKLLTESRELVFRTNSYKVQADLMCKADKKIGEFPAPPFSNQLGRASFDECMREVDFVLGTIRELYDEEMGRYGQKQQLWWIGKS